jgi:hypothetical protein
MELPSFCRLLNGIGGEFRLPPAPEIIGLRPKPLLLLNAEGMVGYTDDEFLCFFDITAILRSNNNFGENYESVG